MRRADTARAAIVLTVLACAMSSGLGAGVAFAASAPAPVTVTCGEVVTTSIVVANDLTCTGDALSVEADGVTLDLGGHTIRGGGSGVGVTVTPNSDNPQITGVTVTDGTIARFGTAVRTAEALSTTLSSLLITNNSGSSDPVIDTRGFTDGLLITGTRITHSQGYVMFAQINVGSVAFADTRISGGTVFFSQSGGPTFIGDTFVNAALTFNIEGGSTVTGSRFVDSPVVNDGLGSFGGDVFKDNAFSGAGTALTLADVNNQQVTGNTFTGNNIGVALADSPGDTISGNKFTHNATAGVYFNGAAGPLSGNGAISVTVSGNTATANGTSPDGTLDPAGLPVDGGLYLYTPGGGNTVTDNHTAHNGGYGIYALPPNTASGNVSTGDAEDCSPLNLCTYK